MVAFLLVFDNILNQLLGILLPFPLPTDFIIDVILIEVRLVHNPFYYQLLKVL